MWTKLIPLPYRWAIIAALFAAATGFGYVRGISHESDKRDLADAKRAKATESAIVARVQSNTATALRQQEANRVITKVHDEELAPVLDSIAADRLRIGPSLCAGPTAPTQAESAGSSHAADPPGRLVSPELTQRIEQLEARVETALAAGRSCQAFVTANGMAP